MWRRGVMVVTTTQLHSTKPELRFCAGSNPARGVLEIRDAEDLWQWSRLEIRLNAFRRSTIPQKQLIIIIIIIIIIIKHKKEKTIKKIIVQIISQNECKDVFLSNKCFIYSINRIQIKDRRIEIYEINKISFSCFDNKIYFQNNGYGRFAPGYQS